MKVFYQTNDGTIFNDLDEALKYEGKPHEKTYNVTLYFSGKYTTTVQAFDEEIAVKLAESECGIDGLTLDLEENANVEEIEQEIE